MIRQITTVSTKGQFVIPSEMRASLGIRPGTRISVTQDGSRIVLEPVTEALVDKTWDARWWTVVVGRAQAAAAQGKRPMVTYVLDSSAILRYLDGEAGSDRVSDIIKAYLAGTCEAIVSALHWGEVAGIICKKRGPQAMDLALVQLSALGIQVVEVDGSRAVRAALIKLKTTIPYIDAFGIELAADFRERVFVTADFDFKAAGRDVKMEFLPAK